ncbi:hypothetical protein Ahy_B09g098835 isoform B [Arachis hypogaea]|uniref:Amino acid transporter transmembrane domain-containing protein n=1 Tax=Arachis hypogaea TaxID=3818 RepID=A0A444XS72_ARAHY|nr:hypothetical protein Ahy_B09g098835 isoform A [Arachis hypogaea]RYQ92610.1 hypothetical protein Ahy_B09g098835 isoform B [Arachis hypogaea]
MAMAMATNEANKKTMEISSAPITPRTGTPMVSSPPVSCPPSQLHSPSLTRSPLLHSENGDEVVGLQQTPKTPRTPLRISNLTPRFITPLGSPVRKALRFTKLDPHDACLPITQSRNGNKFYAAFHTLCSGIGIQALILPFSFTVLGEKLGRVLAMFPIIYLSAGTCTTIIILGASTARTFYQIICGTTCTAKPMTTVEWYLVFTCVAVVLSQLPSLNSIAGVSLIGAVTAVGFCTSIWITSVAQGTLPGVNYNPVRHGTSAKDAFNILNALGIVAFVFRGHNLILEIQATMPSSEKHPCTCQCGKE